MAGGWQDLADSLNDSFSTDQGRKDLSRDFKNKHGPKGDGAGGKKPYKFGHFMHRHESYLKSQKEQSRFLMDSGSRHWGGDVNDPVRGHPGSLQAIEKVVVHSLTNDEPPRRGQLKQITFSVQTDATATVASASVNGFKGANKTPIDASTSDAVLDTQDRFTIDIICPPA